GGRWCGAVSEREPYGDALPGLFGGPAGGRQLLIHRCSSCGSHQFSPRPFCISCQSDGVQWVPAAGTGTVYTRTTVNIEIAPDLKPPYVVAVVELDEGPRLTTNLNGSELRIGGWVQVTRSGRDNLPPC